MKIIVLFIYANREKWWQMRIYKTIEVLLFFVFFCFIAPILFCLSFYDNIAIWDLNLNWLHSFIHLSVAISLVSVSFYFFFLFFLENKHTQINYILTSNFYEETRWFFFKKKEEEKNIQFKHRICYNSFSTSFHYTVFIAHNEINGIIFNSQSYIGTSESVAESFHSHFI